MHPLLKNSNSNAKNTETSVLGSIEIPDSLDDDQRNMIDYNSNLRNYAFDQDVELDDEDEVEEAEDNLEDFKKLVDEMGTESISDLKRQNFHKK